MKIDTVKDCVKDSVRFFTKKIYKLPIGLDIFLKYAVSFWKIKRNQLWNITVIKLNNMCVPDSTQCLWETGASHVNSNRLTPFMKSGLLQNLTFIIEWSNHIPWYFQKEVENLCSQKHLPTDSLKIYSYLLTNYYMLVSEMSVMESCVWTHMPQLVALVDVETALSSC